MEKNNTSPSMLTNKNTAQLVVAVEHTDYFFADG